MDKKLKSIVVALIFALLIQPLIYNFYPLIFLVVLAVWFLLSFFWLESDYFKGKVIFRNILPFFIALGVTSFVFFEGKLLLQQSITIFAAFCLYLFYSRLPIPLKKEMANKVTYHWLDLCLLLTIYLLSLAIYQLVAYANLPLWSLVIGLGILGGTAFGYGLWARRVEKNILFTFLTLFILIILQVFIVLSFWREAFPLYKALILALLYYIFMGLLDIKLKGKRLKNNYLGYLVFAIIIFILIIFSVDWRTFS